MTVWEESCPADELFVIYLKKLFLLAGGIGSGRKPNLLVICVETLLEQTAELFCHRSRAWLYERAAAFYRPERKLLLFCLSPAGRALYA